MHIDYQLCFRRDTKDTEWIRILTLLDVGSQMYNDMSPENIHKKCPAKIICQAFESREILGLSKRNDLFTINHDILLGGQHSYLSLIYQFMSAMNFKPGINSDLEDNFLTVRHLPSL